MNSSCSTSYRYPRVWSTVDFVQTSKDNDEDISILEEDNPQIYAHLDNVLVHMIDKQEAAIFKSKQDFN